MTSQENVPHASAPDPEGTKPGAADPAPRNSDTPHPATPEAAAEKNKQRREDTVETATDATAESDKHESSSASNIVISSSRKARPPYKYDPSKITLRFLFANRDGLAVTVECKPSDTVGEVKGALISVWPDDMPGCSSGENLRLICMGKGFLTPDTRTLEDCQIPVFKTHPTPINVSVKPSAKPHEGLADHFKKKGAIAASGAATEHSNTAMVHETNQGCGCIIQ